MSRLVFWLLDRLADVAAEGAWELRKIGYTLGKVVLSLAALVAAALLLGGLWWTCHPAVVVAAALVLHPTLTCYGNWAMRFLGKLFNVIEY